MKKTGRPTFQLVPDRLKTLRDAAGLTQKQLAHGFYKHLLGDRAEEQRSQETHYQRIEKNGKTSQHFAGAIAHVLAEKLGRNTVVVLADLCGGTPEAPPDRIDEIAAQLQSQLHQGLNEALHLTLDRYSEDEQPIRELARDLANRIEVAQIAQQKSELEELSGITGWTVDKLLQPIGSLGHWILLSGFVMGSNQTRVVAGVNDVLHQIRTEGEEWLNDRNESDVRVVFQVDGLWFRIRMEDPRHPHRTFCFSFVRCSPSASGLSWVKPTPWDRFWIDKLPGWAGVHANFVVRFDGVARPRDLRKLRFVVSSRTVPENPADSPDERKWLKTLFESKGSLDDLPDRTLEISREEGYSHDRATNWASSDLWDELQPHLCEFPASWWRIHAGTGEIRLSLEFTLRELYASGRGLHEIPSPGPRILITLAEEMPGGELRAAPWRRKDSEQVAELRLRAQLQACVDSTLVGPPRPP